jgi:chromosome partitioning protein
MSKQTIISILNQKGGSGKTTLAINIACGLKERDKEVCIVDSDDQRSALDWQERAISENRNHPLVYDITNDSISKIRELVHPKFEYIIIDGSPRVVPRNAKIIKISDLILIPVQPSPYDVWATEEISELIKTRQECNEGKPFSAFILSMVIKNTKLAKEATEALAEFKLPVLNSCTTRLETYKQTVENGQSVFSSSIKNTATKEMDAIINEIMEKYL